ncbi:MAG: PAS domain-containing protein, partial [Chloroflexi bacterium]|nr:PAS domain-containing protein [Chloroflexota bacterium]
DIRGGISIQLPLTHVYQRQNQNILVQSSALGALWLCGLVVLGGVARRWDAHLRQRVSDAARIEVSEARYRALFENSPIGLWEEDLSGIKQRLDDLRAGGVDDLETYLQAHPAAAFECMALGKVLDINQATLRLFGAASKEELLTGLNKIIPPEGLSDFIQELIHIAAGETHFDWQGPNLTLDGRKIYLHLSVTAHCK